MDAGTATLVIYLARMGPDPRELDRLWPYFVEFPKMTLVHNAIAVAHA
jgi:hypothetical protein